MTDDSAFFSLPETGLAADGEMVCIHRSGCGWSELYRVCRGGRFRVLKALKPEYRGMSLYESLLRKEFEIGYSLSHPNICEVYGFSDVPGLGRAIEMEWIDGAPLSGVMASGRIQGKTALRLADQLCDAVGYLHARQVVHRDIKLSNLMVTHNGNNLKIIDFGLSDADSWAVLKGQGGTIGNASPEALAGGVSDCRSDIWSMGKVLSELVPSKRAVARRCMEQDPARRYQDAASVKAALHSHRGIVFLIVLALLVSAAVSALWNPFKAVEAPEPLPVQDSSSVVTDPAVIDELFRQATEMIDAN